LVVALDKGGRKAKVRQGITGQEEFWVEMDARAFNRAFKGLKDRRKNRPGYGEFDGDESA